MNIGLFPARSNGGIFYSQQSTAKIPTNEKSKMKLYIKITRLEDSQLDNSGITDYTYV